MEKIPDINETTDSNVATQTSSGLVRCFTCGEQFTQPLLTTIISGFLNQEYYACPRCLTNTAGTLHEKNRTTEQTEEPRQILETIERIKLEAEKAQPKATCPYQFGYLKKHEKKSPLPEECLICSKMIECRI